MSMVLNIARTSLMALRRDRAALALSFMLPIGFFSIFAVIFGNQHESTPKIKVIVVDQDQSQGSRQLVQALEHEGSLVVSTKPETKKDAPPAPDYTASTAEAAVKEGDFPVALIIPHGFGDHPMSFGPSQPGTPIELLNDASDPIAPQVVSGMLQKVGMTAMPMTMAQQGMDLTGKYIGGFTPSQQKEIDARMARWRELQANGATSAPAETGDADTSGGMIQVHLRSVVGENKNSPMLSYYAAAVGVMFLLFTASGSSGALLDEAESGALDRVLSSRVTMTSLLAGKLLFNTVLAFVQLTVMFIWAWLVFHVDLPSHIPGFLVMGLSTAVAVASLGMLLASICHTRAQLGAVSTIVILSMSSIGGSMFPRYIMSAAMQKAGSFTLNAWAIDGFTKVFWRDLPVTDLWPQVSVLLAIAIVLFAIARRIARRWDYA